MNSFSPMAETYAQNAADTAHLRRAVPRCGCGRRAAAWLHCAPRIAGRPRAERLTTAEYAGLCPRCLVRRGK